ncbi:MAG: NAD-dependent DNA ligase LigA [Lachnospiraceae bacterium]|nr:NAD-dependent DNA ligase LigA [Lachnospiraceae bacterium]
MDKRERMQELITKLNEASKAYYQEDREIMSNFEYDSLYDELGRLEKETGIVMANSPTQRVGYEVLSELEKVRHDSPMLSLDKTKDPQALKAWLNRHKAMLSWKMDGLTVVLTYEGGRLSRAVTRGNGTIGEVITNNARVFRNIPSHIPFEGRVVLRGEAVIRYSDFKKINENITDVSARYKNPRNLCSGTVRQLNNKITAERNVYYFAFTLVEAQGAELGNSVEESQLWLQKMGFTIVPYRMVTEDNIVETIQEFERKIPDNDFPSDGLVVIYDDIAYGRSLGRTAKFPRNSLAFKWQDEEAETVLREVEWSPSRTGLINPVAIFDPVELEGTTVSRASLHNISIIEGLKLGIGDRIKVYKANMIIPQISENLTQSDSLVLPEHCPACGGEVEVHMDVDAKTLYCPNPYCSAKKVKLFAHYVSRDALNIDGLSEMTLQKMIDQGFLNELYDLYELSKYKEQIMSMEGFGEKSYQNMEQAIERSKDTTLARLVYGLGIPNVGASNARVLCQSVGEDMETLEQASVEELADIDGIGIIIAGSVHDYFNNEHNQKVVARLKEILHIREPEPIQEGSQTLEGKTFVITGSVEHFKNRKELKEKIESLGGKVTGSVSKKTDYLINNDVTSQSSKNKKARELEIPILSEDDFLKMI